MAGVTHVLDDDEVLGALSQLGRAIAQPRQAMEALGAHFVYSTQLNFQRETAPDGTRWRPLAPRTANKRVGRGRRGHDHILRLTTRLYRSVNYTATATSLEWGSNLVYAGVHQDGGVISMPAREGRVSLKSIRRKGGGVRSRFARAGTKGAIERKVSLRGYSITVPARPFLGISNFDLVEVPLIVADAIRKDAGQ